MLCLLGGDFVEAMGRSALEDSSGSLRQSRLWVNRASVRPSVQRRSMSVRYTLQMRYASTGLPQKEGD